MLLLVNVDDVLVNGSSLDLIAQMKIDFKTLYEMIDSNKCAFVICIE